ncbi:MAG: hypothetical protein KDD50_02275 [Bdellovibrionales bacterium]|nr:hypothetical protein [Bdellovibrionales bacterium]MCB0413131.1 hypothetical protein [Bdellovibrionales bacterium]
MGLSQKDKLIALGAGTLADLLIEIASDSESANNKVHRAISSQTQNVKLFKEKLKYYKSDGRRYVPWKHSSSFAREISDLIEDIKVGASNPKEGIQLLFEFYKTDEPIFNMVDDSSGSVGDVFRYDALELFVQFAKKIPDKTELLNSIIDLIRNDGYGVRDCLIDEAHRYLNPTELRKMFELLKNDSKKGSSESNASDWKLPHLAKQMKDAPLFEKLTRKRLGENINGKFLVEIAEVYFLAGDLNKAQEILNQVPENDSFSSYEKNNLQKQLFKSTGKIDQLIASLEKDFKDHYSKSTLEELLTVVGQDKREKHCSAAIKDITANRKWNPSHAEFLTYCEAYDETENYVLRHAASLDGDRYYSLLPLARVMEENEKHLVASLIYRALLDSILRRAKSKIYHHGVDYLRKLERLNKNITDWSTFPTHSQYFQSLKQAHARKSGFWSRYSE